MGRALRTLRSQPCLLLFGGGPGGAKKKKGHCGFGSPLSPKNVTSPVANSKQIDNRKPDPFRLHVPDALRLHVTTYYMSMTILYELSGLQPRGPVAPWPRGPVASWRSRAALCHTLPRLARLSRP